MDARNRTALIGRDGEIEALLSHLEAARQGSGGVVLIGGEPGIGKTRLVRELAARAGAAGTRVLQGQAYDVEGMPPYLPLLEALNQCRLAAPADFDAAVRAAPGILTLLPELASRFDDLTPSLPPDPAHQQYALFESVCDFLTTAAGTAGGLLLCFDDLHWADASTLQLFQHLARRAPSAALLAVATYRSTGVTETHPLLPLLAELRRERLAETITPSALSIQDISEMASALSGGREVAQEVAQMLAARTGGNPFFLEEMVLHLQAEEADLSDPRTASLDWGVPEGVRQVIGRRLARLSDKANRVLDAAAVLGDGFRFEVLTAMTDLGADGLVEALDEVTAAGMVREEGEDYRFAHPLIQETLYRRVRVPRRQLLHSRAVAAIESVFAANLDRHTATLAAHCRMAGRHTEPEKTIDYLIRAGKQATTALALDEAVLCWESALKVVHEIDSDPVRRANLLVDVAILMYRAEVRHKESARYMEEAIRLFDEVGDVASARMVRVRLATMITSQRESVNIFRAIELCEEAEAMLSSHDQEAASRVYGAKAFALGLAMRITESSAAAEKALLLASRSEDPAVTGQVLPYHADQFASLGQIDTTLTDCSRLLEIAEEVGDGRLHWLAAEFGSWLICTYLADPLAAEELCQRHLESPLRLHPAGVPNAMIPRIISGRLSEAEELLRIFGRRVSPGDWLYDFWKSDTFEEIETALIHDIEFSSRAGDRWEEAFRGYHLALSRAFRGAAHDAEDGLRGCLETALQAPHIPFELMTRISLAKLLSETVRLDEAKSHLVRCREIIESPGTSDWRGMKGRLVLAEAAVLFAEGTTPDAEAKVTEAIDIFRRYTLVWDEAEALHLWGRALGRGRGSHARALEKLDAAGEIYRRHGAGRRWVESVEAEKSRITGSGTLLPYPDSLSQREVEVLRLIAAGQSNREIADQLVLSIRTVERHIANLYAKAGLRTKAQAASYAHQKNLI